VYRLNKAHGPGSASFHDSSPSPLHFASEYPAQQKAGAQRALFGLICASKAQFCGAFDAVFALFSAPKPPSFVQIRAQNMRQIDVSRTLTVAIASF
jgi:hypothetical protein